MTSLHIELSLALRSDFHIGTGAGQGRTVDAVVLRDPQGFPYVPASTLKGLARWHAERLVDLHRGLGLESVKPQHVRKNRVIVELFGQKGSEAGALLFSDARPAVTTRVPQPEVHGRSARDRRLGRALEDHLFFIEDAAALPYAAVVRTEHQITPHATLLLLLALRRIEHLGGNRRRGKGRVETRLKVTAGPAAFAGLSLPTNAATTGDFERIVREACAGTWNPETDPVLPKGSPDRGEPLPFGRSKGAADEAAPEALLLVFARAAAPLTLPAEPETGNVIGTLAHVTGSSLRGAFAAHLLRRGWAPGSTEFQDAFAREQLRFGPLYPSCEWATVPRTLPVPTPLGIVTCKYHPGVNQHERSHGVRDLFSGSPLATCPCGAPLVPWGAFIQARGDARSQFVERVEPRRTSIQRTAVDPATLRALDGALYSTTAIDAGAWFAGYLRGPEPLLAAVTRGLVDEREPLLLWVGKSRTRGHGALEVWLRRPPPGRHELYPMLLPSDHRIGLDKEVIRLTLYSDLVALDPLLRPITLLTEDALWGLLGGKGVPPFRVDRGYTAHRQIAGFNGAPGLPRSPDIALRAGSAWELHWIDRLTAQRRQEAEKVLADAQRVGLGCRRGEGLGQIVVDLPLHDIDARLNTFDPEKGSPTSFDVCLPCDRGLPQPELRAPVERRQWLRTSRADTSRRPSVPRLGERAGGLARLLRELAQDADPLAGLRNALEARRSFHRHDKKEERVLQTLQAELEALNRAVTEAEGQDAAGTRDRARAEAARILVDYADAFTQQEIQLRRTGE